MRPTARPQSSLRNPLNHVLSAEANVRVLREIMLSEIPIGVSELARRALLQPSGVARVCTKLEDLGVIEAVGRGSRNRQYRRAARYGLAQQLRDLFHGEFNLGQGLLVQIRNAASNPGGIRAAWIEGPVASSSDQPGDPVIVGALAEPADVDAARQALWQQLLGLQASSNVFFELRVVTLADLKTASPSRIAELEGALPLFGPQPLDLIAPRPSTRAADVADKRHADLDLRSLEIARIIADRIRKDASLVEDARRYVERRLPSASPGERLELEEWRAILDSMSIPRLRRFLVQEDERATRLRQSLPFMNVLTDAERRAIVKASVKAK